MTNIEKWLIHSEPWVVYNAKLNLMNNDKQEFLTEAYNSILSHSLVKGIIKKLLQWPYEELNNHKKAGHPNHLLSFLAEIGLTSKTNEIKEICEKVLANISEEGIIESYIKVPAHFGGSGNAEWTWMLCDAPILLFSLQKMGYSDDIRVKNCMDKLINMIFENGWRCTVSKKLGKFRGPGRKEDPCPYTNLIMLKALSASPEINHYKKAIEIGIETILSLWETRRDNHPFIFYMGNDFCKLKFPFVWYDILHVVYVLSHFETARKDNRFKEMANLIFEKKNEEGKYLSESVWQSWKEWDFGQKKVASPTLTYFVYLIKKKLSN